MLVGAFRFMSDWSYMSIKGQDHSMAKGHSDFKIKTCFSQKLFGPMKVNFK